MLPSEANAINAPPSDIEHVADLGLIMTKPSIRISNRIYREVIPRELTWSTQVTIANQESDRG